VAAGLAVPVPPAIELELEWEKSAADEQEHGNERDDAYEKERKPAWDEQKQARANEQEKVKENEPGPEWEQAYGKERAWEQEP
jgi:hypothetical protein